MVQKHRSLSRAASRRAAAALASALRCCSRGCPSPPDPPRDAAGAAAAAARVACPPRRTAAAPPPPRPPPPPRENHSLARHPLAGDAGAHAARSRRHRRRILDARSGAAHRAEQSAAMDRARPAAARGERCPSGRGLRRKALALASGDRGAQGQAGRVLADACAPRDAIRKRAEVESQPYMQ